MIVDYENLFRKHVNGIKVTSIGQAIGLCPFHDDKKPSFSMNFIEGLWNCFGCGKHGNAYQFAEEMKEENAQQYINSTEVRKTSKPIEEKIDFKALADETISYNEVIIDNWEVFKKWYNKTNNTDLFNIWTIDKVFNLCVGFDKKTNSLTFPHFDSEGRIISIHWHKNKIKGVRGCKWYNQYYLSKYDRNKALLITEGEKDCFTAICAGLQATCTTTGASSVPTDMSPIKGFIEYIVIYDNDGPGKEGAVKMANKIKETNPSKNVTIKEVDSIEEGI